MDSIASWAKADRADLIRETGVIKRIAPEIVEKDFWVCWVLDKLFSSKPMTENILFKGGTSLSKVFRLIERFSEDIDLILNWDEVTEEDPRIERSVSKQNTFNKKLLLDSHTYLKNTFLPLVQELLGNLCQATIEDNPEVIKIRYPASFSSDYLRPEIQLEVGPLASWTPNAEYEITPYTAEAFPTVFKKSISRIKTIKAERTFWEKITILHHEAHRPNGKTQPKGYSRHYYDVYWIAKSDVKETAFRNLELLKDVVAFKDKFYHRGWARYDLAIPETMRLIPPDHVIQAVMRDYADMRFMIFGEIPIFDELMKSLQGLEDEINSLPNV